MGNSFESWEIISKMLAKVTGIMGFFWENFVDTLCNKILLKFIKQLFESRTYYGAIIIYGFVFMLVQQMIMQTKTSKSKLL